MPDGDEVQFKSPTTGAVQAVPQEHWDEAIKAGYAPVTHKVMYSPSGDRGMVPNEQLAEKMKAGYQTTPQTSFEKERTSGPRGIFNALKRMAPPDPTGGRSPFDPKFWLNTDQARLDPFGPGTAYSDVTRPLPQDLPTEVLGAGRTGGNAIYRGASLFSGLAGVNPENMEEASGRADTSGVATQAGVPAALAISAPLLRGYAKPLFSGTRASLARVMRDPLTGNPLSPREAAINRLLPDPDAVARAQAQAIPQNEAMRAKSSEEFANRQSDIESARQKELADMERFKEQDAQARMRRGSQQDALDRTASPDPLAQAVKQGIASRIPTKMPSPFAPPATSPFLGATPSNAVFGNAELPPAGSYELPKMITPAQNPYAAPIEAPSAEGVPGSVPKPSGRLVVLPQEAQALDQMQRIAKQRASEHGMQYAAGMRPAGGGRVPMSPTRTMTTEFPGTREAIPQGNQTPFSPPFKMETDTMGLKWAVSPDGQYRVTIPASIPDEGIAAYAVPRLAEQARIFSSLGGAR